MKENSNTEIFKYGICKLLRHEKIPKTRNLAGYTAWLLNVKKVSNLAPQVSTSYFRIYRFLEVECHTGVLANLQAQLGFQNQKILKHMYI